MRFADRNPRALPMPCIMLLATGCGSWAWEKPGGPVPAPEFKHDNRECLGERVPVKTAVPVGEEIFDCSLRQGRTVESYNECMSAKGYERVWKSGSP